MRVHALSIAAFGTALALDLTACKTPLAQSPQPVLKTDSVAEAANVTLPVTGGPGRISVTAGEYEFVRALATSGKVFRHPAFWDFFAAHEDLARRLLETRWFTSLPAERQRILDAANALGKHFILYLDMGIAIRATEFRDFARARLAREPGISSFALRQAFADSLPKVTVWRGVLLTPEEAVAVRRDGIKASGFYQDEAMRHGFLAGEFLLKQAYVSHPSSAYDDMNRRLNGMTGQSIYSSFSTWIEVTYAGCWLPPLQGGGPLRSVRGVKFHLFKVEVSELDLVRPNGMLSPLVAGKRLVYRTTGLDGREWTRPFADPEFEMFIQFVEPTEILEMQVYDQMPPRWRT